MSKEKTALHSEKRTPKKGSAPYGVSQLAVGGELHQLAGGKHPALTTNEGVVERGAATPAAADAEVSRGMKVSRGPV